MILMCGLKNQFLCYAKTKIRETGQVKPTHLNSVTLDLCLHLCTHHPDHKTMHLQHRRLPCAPCVSNPSQSHASSDQRIVLLVLLKTFFSSFIVFCFGCGMQWLDVGARFPDQGLNLDGSSESAKSYPLDLQQLPQF